MPFHFINVLVFGVTGAGFIFATLLAARFVRPYFPTAEKSMIYECGEKPTGKAWFNFNPRFYLIALVFVIFEVEIAFMFPVALVYKRWVLAGNGGVAFAEILVFSVILMVGLAYVWIMGDLDWIKSLKSDRPQVPLAPHLQPRKEAA